MIYRFLIWLSLQFTLVNGDVTPDQLQGVCRVEDQECMKNWVILQRKQCSETAKGAIPKNEWFGYNREWYISDWASDANVGKDIVPTTNPGQETTLSYEQCCNLVNSFCSQCNNMAVNGIKPGESLITESGRRLEKYTSFIRELDPKFSVSVRYYQRHTYNMYI